jgi:hypothetical protein
MLSRLSSRVQQVDYVHLELVPHDDANSSRADENGSLSMPQDYKVHPVTKEIW